MILVTIVFLALILLSALGFVKELNANARFLLLLCVNAVLVTLATTRVGDRDFLNYIDIFNDCPKLFDFSLSTEIHGEPGFLLLCSIIKTIGLNFRVLLFVVSFASVSLALNFFRKYAYFEFVAVVIYFAHVFLLRDMMQIRAGLAASISLYFIPYLYRGKWIQAALIILLASLFHSAVLALLLVLPIYPVYKRNPNLLYYLLMAGLLIGLILDKNLFAYIIERFFNLPSVVIYLFDEEYFYSLGLLNPVFIKALLISIVCMRYKELLEQRVPYFHLFLLTYVIGCFWLSAFQSFAIVGARVATFFTNAEHILMPALLFLIDYKFIAWMLIVLLSIVAFYPKFEIFKELTYTFL